VTNILWILANLSDWIGAIVGIHVQISEKSHAAVNMAKGKSSGSSAHQK
jgi:hypothetical protein